MGKTALPERAKPRTPKPLPRHGFTAAEAERVLAQPNLHTPLGLRDRAILEVFYATGMRRAELATIREHDVIPDRRTVVIRRGKGGKDRVVPIGQRALGWIAQYRAHARPRLVVMPDERFLFLSTAGEPLGLSRLTRIVRKHIESAGLGVGRVGACHLFRHTMATLMLDNGADIRAIQEILGHERLETTAIYTQVSIPWLVEVHAATHPASAPRAPSADRQPRRAAEREALLADLAHERAASERDEGAGSDG